MGPDAEAIAEAVRALPSVAALGGGGVTQVATFLPGRRVPGVRVADGRVEVHVTARLDMPLQDVAQSVRAAAALHARRSAGGRVDRRRRGARPRRAVRTGGRAARVDRAVAEPGGGRVSDPSAVLGVGPGATPAQVHDAWRRAARRVHPDAGGDPAAFREVAAAYEALLHRPAPSVRPTVVPRPQGAALARRWLQRRIDRTRHPRVV